MSECHSPCKQWPCLVVCDKPGCTGCRGKNGFRDRAWQSHVVLSSSGSFVVGKAKGTLNSGPFPVIIKQLLPPPARRSPAKVSLVWCMEMWIKQYLLCCPVIQCNGFPSEKSFADNKLNQSAVTALEREVGGRVEFN